MRGKDTAQWLDYGTYTYKPFYQRYTEVFLKYTNGNNMKDFYDRKNKTTAKRRPGDPIILIKNIVSNYKQ